MDLIQNVLKEWSRATTARSSWPDRSPAIFRGAFQAVDNGIKAFIDSFTEALRNEIRDSEGITLTTPMPRPFETEFFARGDMLDTSVDASDNRSDCAERGGQNLFQSPLRRTSAATAAAGRGLTGEA